MNVTTVYHFGAKRTFLPMIFHTQKTDKYTKVKIFDTHKKAFFPSPSPKGAFACFSLLGVFCVVSSGQNRPQGSKILCLFLSITY